MPLQATATRLPIPPGLRSKASVLAFCFAILATAGCGRSSLDGSASSEVAARQRARPTYLQNCAPCHGERADGLGPSHANLSPPPRDYTDPAWRATVTMESVQAVIAHGVEGTAMPAWQDYMSTEEIRDMATYVLSVAERGPWVDGENEGHEKDGAGRLE